MNPLRRQRGFVLILVLVIVAMAAVLLSGRVRRAGQLAVDVREGARRLQMEWAARSCRDVLLPRSRAFLTDTVTGRPRALTRYELSLGDLPLTLVFADEQAKANVNTLARELGRDGFELRLLELQRGVRRPVAIQWPALPDGTAMPMAFFSYDQLFAARPPVEWFDPDGPDQSPTALLTCWGDGRVNVRTASREVLHHTLQRVAGEADVATIMKLRDENPAVSLQNVLKALELPPEQAARVARLLCDRSETTSLWVVARSPRRNDYRFYVGSGPDGTLTFGW